MAAVAFDASALLLALAPDTKAPRNPDTRKPVELAGKRMKKHTKPETDPEIGVRPQFRPDMVRTRTTKPPIQWIGVFRNTLIPQLDLVAGARCHHKPTTWPVRVALAN